MRNYRREISYYQQGEEFFPHYKKKEAKERQRRKNGFGRIK